MPWDGTTTTCWAVDSNAWGKRLRTAGVISRFRAVTDAAPVLEREWALLGNLGFRGKNTLVLHPTEGSWHLLGELLMDGEWDAWAPESPAATCGSCTRCLDACPTQAFPTPYSLEPRRCISYLTIEHRGPIPRDLRPLLGDWVFGCDVCMEVCPFGAEQPNREEEWGLHPALEKWSLEDLLTMEEPRFHEEFAGSPVRRASWPGLLRNACVVLGNLGRGQAALSKALEHPSQLVRGHAAWALGRLACVHSLQKRLPLEELPEVQEEIRSALEEAGG